MPSPTQRPSPLGAGEPALGGLPLDVLHSEKLGRFRWVKALLGNLKSATTGTFHLIRKHYVHRYLAEFQYRFDRRSELPENLAYLANAAVRTKPKPHADMLCAYESVYSVKAYPSFSTRFRISR